MPMLQGRRLTKTLQEAIPNLGHQAVAVSSSLQSSGGVSASWKGLTLYNSARLIALNMRTAFGYALLMAALAQSSARSLTLPAYNESSGVRNITHCTTARLHDI